MRLGALRPVGPTLRSETMELLAKARVFGGEVVGELKKVTWPDRPQLKNATLVIIVFVLLVAAIIWGIDLVVRTVLDLILNLFAG